MKQAIGATSDSKRDARIVILLIPTAVLQTFLISSLSWWHVPLVRLVGVGFLATVSVIFLRRAILRAGESAEWRVLVLGVIWSGAFLLSGLLGSDPMGVLFGFLMALTGGRLLWRVVRRLQSAGYSSGVRWYQGAPRTIPRVSARILDTKSAVVADLCQVARMDGRGIFLLLPRGTELKPGDFQIDLSGAGIELMQPARLNLTWERSTFRGAGFLFSQMDQVAISKPIGDWMNRLEGRGYEQLV